MQDIVFEQKGSSEPIDRSLGTLKSSSVHQFHVRWQGITFGRIAFSSDAMGCFHHRMNWKNARFCICDDGVDSKNMSYHCNYPLSICKSSILTGLSLKNHPSWVPPWLWKPPYVGFHTKDGWIQTCSSGVATPGLRLRWPLEEREQVRSTSAVETHGIRSAIRPIFFFGSWNSMTLDHQLWYSSSPIPKVKALQISTYSFG